MDKRKLVDMLFDKGKAEGFLDMEAYISRNKNLNLRVFDEEIDNYSISEEEGISFRGLYNGKMGYSYSEKIDETSVDMLINEAKGNATIIDTEDEEFIFEGSKDYKEVSIYNEDFENVNPEKKIEFTINLEKEAKKLDERVKAVNYCLFGEISNSRLMINSKGLDLEDKSNIAYTYVSVMVKDGEDIKTSGKYIVSNDFDKFDAKSLAKEAVDEAISMLGADSVDSKEYSIILRNNVSTDILEAFSSIFSAEKVQKELSLLKGKIGESISSDILTIIDDPFMKDGIASSSFDGEGVASKYKKIVDKGVLKTYLHNLKTAKKDGVESTGNANKPSYKSSIGIAPTNMYIEKGEYSLDDMIKSMGNGILITDVEGLHSGLNPVSGDFSLSAYGYEVSNGEITRSINQITIAGNYFEVLKNVETVGNDIKFGLPSGSGYIGSPSLKIKGLNVSGK